MTMRSWGESPGMRIALCALGIAAVIMVWTVVNALRVVHVPIVPVNAITTLETMSHGSAQPTVDIEAAVDKDVFSPDRAAPSSPYRMPDEHKADDMQVIEPEKPLVLGTAVATDGRHFATVQLGDASPTLVHVGDRIGEWIVRAIERGKIVLVSAGGTRTNVTVPKPGT